MKSVDGITRPKSMARTHTNPQGLSLGTLKESPLTFSHWPMAVAIIFVAILINSVTLLSAFEAHVINVTATIERRPAQCGALSPGYWRNHEGCAAGAGESIWTSQINALSSTFSGVFAGFSGAAICGAQWQPNCPSGRTREGRLCRAKIHTLADELNLVSGHLDLNALIAGADQGNGAFARLGLSPSSTVGEALTAVEQVIADNAIDEAFIIDAAQVAGRIYSFYEDENPIAPQCIFEPDQLNLLSPEPLSDSESQSFSIGEIEDETETTTIEATSTLFVIEEVTTPPVIEEIVVEEASTTPEIIEPVIEPVAEEIPEAENETIETAETEINEINETVETVEAEEANEAE